jgi:5-methylcytosine-specific restriction protein B
MAGNDDWQQSHVPPHLNNIASKLKQLHAVLSVYGFEFGHRVFYEALRFSAFASAAGLDQPADILDRIVFQKILPRLHGSRRRLEFPLLALAHFCRDLSEVAQEDKLLALRPEVLAVGQPPQLPDSYDKVCRMLKALRTNQFASFTE